MRAVITDVPKIPTVSTSHDCGSLSRVVMVRKTDHRMINHKKPEAVSITGIFFVFNPLADLFFVDVCQHFCTFFVTVPCLLGVSLYWNWFMKLFRKTLNLSYVWSRKFEYISKPKGLRWWIFSCLGYIHSNRVTIEICNFNFGSFKEL